MQMLKKDITKILRILPLLYNAGQGRLIEMEKISPY